MAIFGGERESEVKYVQLVSHNNGLYALDSSGQVWKFVMAAGYIKGAWAKVPMTQLEDDDVRRL